MLIYKKTFLMVMLLSLLLGVVGCFAVRDQIFREPGQGYAVLVLDEAFPERAVVDALDGAGIGPVIAESTQWVFLDEFGELTRLPLDSFPERIEDFDPRNDGYAQRLRAFFVRDGNRRLYVPLSAGLERRITAVLEDIPFTMELFASDRTGLWFFIIFALAAVGSICLAGPSLSTVALIPPMIGLAFAGPPGFALAAALFGLLGILRAPLSEAFRARRTPVGLWGSFRFSWLLALLFVGLYGAIWYWGSIPLFIGVLGILSFCAVLCVTLLIGFRFEKDRGHIRFMPVPIRNSSLGFSLFPRTMIPFALASIVALFIPPFFSGGPVQESWEEHPFLISAAEYEAHAAFQAVFSFRSLGTGDLEPELPYLRYSLGEDGLIQEGLTHVVAEYEAAAESIPPFPLEELMAFLGGYRREAPPSEIERLLALVMAALCIPALIPKPRRRGKIGALFILNDKRIAA